MPKCKKLHSLIIVSHFCFFLKGMIKIYSYSASTISSKNFAASLMQS